MAANVETREFGLYNRQGGRVVFGTQDNRGFPELIFLNTNMSDIMRLRVWQDRGEFLVLSSATGRGMRGISAHRSKGASVLNLVGKEQKGSIMLAVSEDGVPENRGEGQYGEADLEAACGSPIRPSCPGGWYGVAIDQREHEEQAAQKFNVLKRGSHGLSSQGVRETMSRSVIRGLLTISFGAGLLIGPLGCGSSNTNEQEFLSSAPPGPAVAARRVRGTKSPNV